MLLKSRKGQGLPMNTVIIAILVIVVLVILIAFFLSGVGTTFQKVKDIFGFGLRGTDLSTAKLACEQYCDQALTLSEEQQPDSAYCNTWFKLDINPNDGSVDIIKSGDFKGQPLHYYCGIQASNVNSADELLASTKTVGVNCNVQCTGFGQGAGVLST